MLYCTTSLCPSECCANYSQSTLIFLPCLDLIHAAGILFSSTSYSSRLDVIHAAGILFSSTSYSSHCIVQLPTVTVRAVLTIQKACQPSHRFIFAIVFACISLTAIFIDIVLVASCLIQQTAFVSVTQSYAVYGDVVYRCKFDVMNRTALSQKAWNQMQV